MYIAIMWIERVKLRREYTRTSGVIFILQNNTIIHKRPDLYERIIKG